MLGSIIGAVGGLLGGLFDKSSAEKNAEKQAALQREFAQNGIRWKVEDAKAAGIHPLYALGANTATYSPISIGTDFASVGQNIGRAIDAGRTGSEKGSAFEKTVQDLTLQKMGLENQLLASQIRTINQPGHPPTRLTAGTAAPATMSSGGGGITIDVNPANTAAQDAESQYGEIGGEVIGLPNLGDDFLRTHLPRVAESGHITQYVQDAVEQWLVETGNKIYANKPKRPRSYTSFKPKPSGTRRYTFVP